MRPRQKGTEIESSDCLLEAHRTENYRASGFRAFDSTGLRVGPGISEVLSIGPRALAIGLRAFTKIVLMH